MESTSRLTIVESSTRRALGGALGVGRIAVVAVSSAVELLDRNVQAHLFPAALNDQTHPVSGPELGHCFDCLLWVS